MFTFLDSYVVRRFVQKPIKSDSGKSDYIFLDHGFFDVQTLAFCIIVPANLAWMYGLYLVISQGLWTTLAFATPFMVWGHLGAMAGAHRLWCHRSYEAKWPLRLFLAIGETISGEFSIQTWASHHRVHHKFTDTDADPHNVKRGFFFAHMGFQFTKENPMVEHKGKTLDFSDLRKDPIVRNQYDYYFVWYAIFGIAMPVASAVFVLGETWWNAYFIMFFVRMLTTIHSAFLINSAAHMFGEKPYNDKIASSENTWVSIASYGEGYHNYHHSFPWDYAAGELGNKFNFTKKFIDVMAFFGQAYNLRTTSKDMINKTKERVKKNLMTREHAEILDAVTARDSFAG